MNDDDLTSIAPKGYRSKQAEREARLPASARQECEGIPPPAEVKVSQVNKDAMPQGEQEAPKEAEEVEVLTEVERLKKRIAELEQQKK